jgi:hypothetical protein
MFNPSCLVLQILNEGRIDADEAAVLLRAVVARQTACAIRAAKPVESTAIREFLPWSLPSVWSGSTNEVI